MTLLDVYGECCKRMVLGKKIGKLHEFTNWGIVDPAPIMNELICYLEINEDGILVTDDWKIWRLSCRVL